MKRLLVVVASSLVGYVVGVVTLLVWTGTQIYDGMFGDDD